MLHFDTNFIIQAVGAGAPAKIQFRKWTISENCNVSTVAWSEFLCGPLDSNAEFFARQVFPNPEPMLAADAELAAIAIRCNAKLATLNIPDFQAFAKYGLVLVENF